jgi:hypothetical protein
MKNVWPVEESAIEVTEPLVSPVAGARGSEVVPAVEIAELDGSALVRAADRFATFPLLFGEAAELTAISAGLVIDTLIPEAAFARFVGIVKRF